VAAYERAESLGASSAEMDAHLGLAYYELARYDEAVEHLNKAVVLSADRPGEELVDVYYALGGSYFALQDYEQAINYYQQAQELDPEGQTVWASEAQANLEEAYLKLAQQVMGEAVLDLDFSNIVTEGEETYAVARTGQRARIEGTVHLVDGPAEGLQALMVEEGTVNEIKNPIFGINITDGWANHSGAELARDTTRSFAGSASCKIISQSGKNATIKSNTIRIDDNEYVTVQARLWLEDGAKADILLRDSAGVSSYGSASTTTVGRWVHLAFTYHNLTGDSLELRLFVRNKTQDGITPIWVDALQAEKKACATSLCHGNAGDGYFWGANEPHAGASERMTTTVSLDDYVDLISNKNQLSFRSVAQMPYDADGTWPGTSVVIDYRQATTGDRTLVYFNPPDDKFYMNVPGVERGSSTQTFKAGDWLDIVLTLDYNGYMRLYINGEEEASGDISALSAPIPTDWTLGGRYDLSGNQGGFAFSEFAIFDRVLTAEEMTALYRGGGG